MKTAGIIAEYNPFHAGHRYHIEKTRQLTGADYVVAVMSGNYVQRGEPAITDKYMRTQMALSGGADLVIELPVPYATASAEFFARAGTGLLASLGVVDLLSFGTEWAGAEELASLAELFLEEPDDYRRLLQEGLKAGKNYPTARADAAAAMFGEEGGRIRKILQEPNHILGIEYIKASRALKTGFDLLAVPRLGASFHDLKTDSSFPSATGIRRHLKEGLADSELIRSQGEGFSGFLAHFHGGETVSWDDLMPLLDYIYLFEKETIGNYFGMDPELTRRMHRLYRPGLSLEETVCLLHSRNRTDSALRRALLHCLLRIREYDFLAGSDSLIFPYIRVLGFRRAAAPLLRRIREASSAAVIQKPAAGRALFAGHSRERALFETDLRCSQLYEQIAAKRTGREPVSELSREQIIQDDPGDRRDRDNNRKKDRYRKYKRLLLRKQV